MFDINSYTFTRALLGGTRYQTIEFKFYRPSTTGPFYSIKLSNILFLGYNYLQLNSADGLVETYTVHFDIIGFKDWVNTQSFSYNLLPRTFGVY